MDFSSLRSLFLKWLPFFLIILILMGMVFFLIRMLVPRWQEHQAVSGTVEAQRVVVATQLAAQNDTSNQIILQHQIDRVQQNLSDAGVSFLLHSEAEELLDRLYNYAYSRGVRVVDLQSQSASAAPEATAAPYEAALYQVQVAGSVSNLVDFVAHFKEASLPAVNIVSMSALSNTDPTTLTMMLQFYTSPYASGAALNGYPTPVPITPSPTPTATLVLPTATQPEITYTPSPIPPTPTPTNTVTIEPYLTPTLIPTLDTAGALTEEVINCPGAAATLLQVGDIAVVDFNEMGALRVLADPNGPITSTRTQAYDNQRLEIITGPVCANSSYYWYVRNLSLGDSLGWVAEGRGEERWLCPEANPECVP